MREIIPSLLWVGNALDARDLKTVFGQQIRAIIDLAREESPVSAARELVYCRFPFVDGQGNSPAIIESAISAAVRLVTAKVPTLISCGGGMSRSPAIAAAVMAQIDAIGPEEAIKRVAASGPHDVAPLFWSEVIDVLRKLPAGRGRTTERPSKSAPKIRLVVVRTMGAERLTAFYRSLECSSPRSSTATGLDISLLNSRTLSLRFIQPRLRTTSTERLVSGFRSQTFTVQSKPWRRSGLRSPCSQSKLRGV